MTVINNGLALIADTAQRKYQLGVLLYCQKKVKPIIDEFESE